MTMRPFLISLILLSALACGRVSPGQARSLVARYNEVVSEAYRRNDITLIDPVVGPNAADGRRLTGLIGVRVDMGLTLDAHLESLEILGVEQSGKDLRIRTRERWRYRDLETKTGRQVGEASVDLYEMLYRFEKQKGVWMVEETSFASQPQVGRKEVPWSMDVRDAHGLSTPPAAPGGKP